MNTNLMQHNKSVLFLVSLSQTKIQEIEEKGVDYELFLKTIRGYSHVEFHETINEELISMAYIYKVVVIVGHQIDGCIEMPDSSLFPMNNIPQALPIQFNGYLHVAVCGSTMIFDSIKKRCPDSKVRTSNNTTQLELQLLIYSLLLSRTDLNKMSFDQWYKHYKESIREIQDQKNPKDLAKLPWATKLGTESSEDIKTSIFMPNKVTRGEFFKLQIKIHLDIDTGTLYLEDARGNDPNTAQRRKNVVIKDINKGDKLTLIVGFLDVENRLPTKDIIIQTNEGIKLNEKNCYTKNFTISNEDQIMQFHVKVTNDYFYNRFCTIIEFIKDSKRILEQFDFETEVIQSVVKTKRQQERFRNAPTKMVRGVEKFPLANLIQKKKPRETMTFKRKSCVLDAHLTVLFHKLTDDKKGKIPWISGEEANFKALFSGKFDEECQLTWTGNYGKGTLVELFKQMIATKLITVPDGFTLSAILEGHFMDANGNWLTGLDKGNAARKNALPFILECVKQLEADPQKASYRDDEDFQSKYDPRDHQDLKYHKSR